MVNRTVRTPNQLNNASNTASNEEKQTNPAVNDVRHTQQEIRQDVASVEDTVQVLLEVYNITTLNVEDEARYSPIDLIKQATDAALLSTHAAQTCGRSIRNSEQNVAVLIDSEVLFAPSLQLPPNAEKKK